MPTKVSARPLSRKLVISMCTIGTLRLGSEYLLFKNKDFGRENFEDQIVLSKDLIGIKGVSTWANHDASGDQFSGFSIGANRYGLFCCDANVREEPVGGKNYDVLTEIVLTEADSVESAISVVQGAVALCDYWCANLVLIDGETSAAIEVHGNKIAVERHQSRITRTNHHLLFDSSAYDGDTITSESRLSFSKKRLATASSVEDVYLLQASHDSGATGICNHAVHQTVYSYVFYFRDGHVSLKVKKGRPCSGEGEFQDLVLPFGEGWTVEGEDDFRARYPSNF